jgi:hypothetical protein
MQSNDELDLQDDIPPEPNFADTLLIELLREIKNQTRAEELERLLKSAMEPTLQKYIAHLKKGLGEEMQQWMRQNPPHTKGINFLSIDTLKKAALFSGSLVASGILIAFLGCYFGLKPLEKKIDAYYTMGTMLEKAWPKLTDKEKKRMKELF